MSNASDDQSADPPSSWPPPSSAATSAAPPPSWPAPPPTTAQPPAGYVPPGVGPPPNGPSGYGPPAQGSPPPAPPWPPSPDPRFAAGNPAGPGPDPVGAWGPPARPSAGATPSAPGHTHRGSRIALAVVGGIVVLALLGVAEAAVLPTKTKTETVNHVVVRTAPISESPDDTHHLRALVIPQPDGYSTEQEDTDGPVDEVGFDIYMSDRSAASSLDFVGGYDQTYDATGGNSIEVGVFQFGTSSDAQHFVEAYLEQFSFEGTPDPTIAGAQDYDETDSDSDGSSPLDHGIIGVKGNRVYVVDYYIVPPAGRPDALATTAQAEVALL